MPEWIEVAMRTLLSVVSLFIVTKLLGKRQISQLSLFEYITGITIGSLAAYISMETQSSWYLGIVSLLVWSGFSLGIELLQMKSKRLRAFFDGRATVLIQKGKILEKNLKKERLTLDELLEQLRSKNAFKVSEVEFALIEPSGQINIMLKRAERPLTARIMNLDVGEEREPHTIIMDGKVLQKELESSGYEWKWVQRELDKLGVRLPEVFLAQLDAKGQLYVDLYEDGMRKA